jgi:DNA-dependent RNA polymerase auxiliary subunit epsilon
LIYFNLPTEITRKSDIEFGNKIVENIKVYQKLNNKFPESDNWETLTEFGFIIEINGTKPAYEKINDNEFELIYLEGFDGPYLLFNSKSKKWKVDFPKIPERLKEK